MKINNINVEIGKQFIDEVKKIPQGLKIYKDAGT